MNKRKESKINIVMSCRGSMDLIRSHKEKVSKGIFYCPDYQGKVILVDTTKGYTEHFFNDMEQLEKYVNEVY